MAPVQADKPWYDYFIPLSSVLTLLSMEYFVLQFAISGKGSVKDLLCGDNLPLSLKIQNNRRYNFGKSVKTILDSFTRNRLIKLF